MKSKKAISLTSSLRVNEEIQGAVLADKLARRTESKKSVLIFSTNLGQF